MTATTSSPSATPTLIEGDTLALAWARMIVHLGEHKGNIISPLVLSVANDTADRMLAEDSRLRTALDSVLANHKDKPFSVDVVAFTIFPQRYLDNSDNRHEFFEYYEAAFPRLQAMNPLNRRGLYFQRLTMAGANVPCNGNQLEFIITQFNNRDAVRASMFQASIFDPTQDHTASARLGFPCLQHVSFVPHGGELVMNAFYATQKVLTKSYGNYLGLIRLGRFMAVEMNLRLTRFNVFVGVAKLDEIGKTTSAFRPILDAATSLVGVTP